MNSDSGQKIHCIDGEEVSEYGFLTYKYWQWRSRFFISALIWALLLGAVGYCVGYFSAIELILHNSCLQQQVK
jgi:hypothetical protein